MGNMRTFRCDNSTWRKFKLICTMENISMQDKLGSMVEDVVKTKKLNTDSLIEKDIKSS
jgi:hypothetical protein